MVVQLLQGAVRGMELWHPWGACSSEDPLCNAQCHLLLVQFPAISSCPVSSHREGISTSPSLPSLRKLWAALRSPLILLKLSKPSDHSHSPQALHWRPYTTQLPPGTVWQPNILMIWRHPKLHTGPGGRLHQCTAEWDNLCLMLSSTQLAFFADPYSTCHQLKPPVLFL